MLFKRIRAPPEVFPLIFIVSGAGALLSFFAIRAITRYPDVVWDHKNNPHPWLSVKPREQIKLFSHYDYDKLDVANVPKIE